MPTWKIGRLKGRFVVSIYADDGKRTHRYRLDAGTAGDAEREAPAVVATLTRPRGILVADLWPAFIADRHGRAILETMVHTWKAIKPSFGHLAGNMITVEHCRAHVTRRRKGGIKDGTIATELGHLRTVLKWAEKKNLIDRASHIERPPPPKRRGIHLTRRQCQTLIATAAFPHIKLFIVLALGTGARDAALRGLTWDRCDFERGLIDFNDPAITRPHKGRAVVPMNRTVRAALIEAKPAALSDYVVEWAGQPVGSVKRGLKAVARSARINEPVSPHIFRHSAAVHMAEADISMDVIAQFLGHENVEITRKVYARYSPSYLRRAGAVLEYDDIGSSNLPSTTLDPEKLPEYMVGATGIEPVTPTMSTNYPMRKAR